MRERGNRNSIVLATKCAGAMGSGPNDVGLSRYHIHKAVDESLRRLGTDVIDLYQVHSFDPRTPIEETMRALDDLVRWGKVRYVGCSNYPAWRLGQALATSDRLGIARYDSLQPRYNMLYRDIETELLPLVRAEGLGVVVYNPLAGGFLSGKHRKNEEPPENTRFNLGTAGRMYRYRYWQDEQFDAVEALRAAVDERGADIVGVAVQWVLSQPGITSAIVGASHPDQLEASLRAPETTIDDGLREVCDGLWYDLSRRPVLEGYR
jgi:aryl-alcohol dehydrogenase-like predicted oxidoreductase